MTQAEVEQIAQQLVDLTIQINSLKEKAEDYRWMLMGEVNGIIKCNGGNIRYREASEMNVC